jgi:hypothetical protein
MKMMGKHSVWFVRTDTEREQRGKRGFSVPSAKCGPMQNAQLAFPGGIFAPTASRMYQIKISEVLWTYISVLSFIFQCNF